MTWVVTTAEGPQTFSDRSEFLREVNRLVCKRVEFSVSFS